LKGCAGVQIYLLSSHLSSPITEQLLQSFTVHRSSFS